MSVRGGRDTRRQPRSVQLTMPRGGCPVCSILTETSQELDSSTSLRPNKAICSHSQVVVDHEGGTIATANVHIGSVYTSIPCFSGVPMHMKAMSLSDATSVADQYSGKRRRAAVLPILELHPEFTSH